MRSALARSAAIGIIIVVLIAVIGLAVALTTMAPPAPPKPSRLVIGVTDKVTDIDPASAYDFFTWEVLNNIMAGLVQYKPGTADIIPGLASNWTVSPDGLTYTFKLRPNLKFSDGTPLKAADVMRSINRVITINAPEGPGWLISSFVKDVTAPDDSTVVFHLINPVSYFLALLATPPYFPIHPSYKSSAVDSDQTAGGAGPYRIVKWVRDQELDLTANPYYWGGAPSIQNVTIRFYKDAASLRAALEAGEVHIAWRTLNPTDIASLSTNPNFNVIGVPGAFIRYIIFNTRTPPLNDVRVREALAAAVNRTDIARRVFQGTVTPLFTLVPIGMWSHVDVFKSAYGDGNVTLAKQLLSQAGYSATNKLSIELWYTPSHYGSTEANLAQVLKEQWESTGLVSVTIKSAEWSAYLKQAEQGVMMVSLFGWYPDYLDPDDYLSPFLEAGSNRWTGSGYNNTQVNALLAQARAKVTIEERTPLYQQVQQILAQEAPFVPLVQGKLSLVTSKAIDPTSIVLGPDMLFRYWLVRWA